jgi:hypothetical protein
MARPARSARPRPVSPARHHADWLRLVEVSGPFLSIPALTRAFPQGLPRDDATSELRKRFRVALDEWEEEGRGDPAIHQRFIQLVLRELLGWPAENLKEGQALPPGLAHAVAEHGETLRPDLALVNPGGRAAAGKARVLVQVVRPGQDLERAVDGRRWKASPATRAMELCHAAEVPLALVTNGAAFTLVHARRGETTTYATFHAPLFVEEPVLFDAFRALLGQQRLFGVADADTLEALLAESAANQQEVTDQLGSQVRHAVEVLVQAIDRANNDLKGALLREVPEKTLYEAAVSVMMRLVFLLAAEERKLLLLGDPLYDAHYAASTLLVQLEEVATKHGEEVLERRFAAWARLLATFRAVHGGVDHDRLRLPAYGGSLFDPDRFPFLEGRAVGSRWRYEPARPVAVDDRTVYHLLRSLQLLELAMPGGGREARRLSFWALDVEQIGHVYEGLLDHTVVRATEPILGLTGAKGLDPELPLSRLEQGRKRGEGELVELLEQETGRSKAAIERAVAAPAYDEPESAGRLLLACDGDERLRDAVRPWAGLLRKDSQDYPLVIKPGSIYVTSGSDRRSTGTHYTPRSLTEPVVQYALEPHAYRGPAEGWPREKWGLRSARELLALRVCDMAMGSGAFLAQACRWLGDRLVEAWEEAEANAGGKLVVTPEGDLATGAPGERPIPKSAEERITLARRAVAERCLYGVDVNPMAVEIAKLSLWLVTLQKDRPFTFVDHALRAGDSLLGVTSPEQIAFFHLDPEKGRVVHQKLVNWTAACEPALKEALEKRRKLESFTVESARDAEEKERLLTEANRALADVRLMADAVVGAALATADRGDDAYADQLIALTQVVSVALDPNVGTEGRAAARAQLESKVKQLTNAGKPIRGARRHPFHWALEFPEVFTGEAAERGFEALIGNPPFMHGSRIGAVLGDDYARLTKDLLLQTPGKIDLAVYFLRRAANLARPYATISLITTSKAYEGDARRAGLDVLQALGLRIRHEEHNMRWPGAAAVLVSCVHLMRENDTGALTREAPALTVYPNPLEVMDTFVYLGAKPDSLGFLLSRQEALDLLERYPEFRVCLRPYLNGSDLNELSRIEDVSRYIIDFSEIDLSEAQERFTPLLRIVEREVKPGRMQLKRKAYRERWWQFTEPQLSLYRIIRKKTFAVALSRVAKFVFPRVVPVAPVYSDKVVVFTTDDYGHFAVLASSIHGAWALKWSSTHGSGTADYLNYKPSDCGSTFPLPCRSENWNTLAEAGLRYSSATEREFVSSGKGPTALSDEMHSRGRDSAHLVDLRREFQELDLTAIEAYGWTDLDLGHGFHETKQGVRFTISEAARREVLARLLTLNHERYAEEVKQGLHEPGKKGKAKAASANPANPGAQASLFGAGPAPSRVSHGPDHPPRKRT